MIKSGRGRLALAAVSAGAAAGVGLVAPTASAATGITVDNTDASCSDSAGSAVYCDINAAVAAAGPGDTVSVLKGTYVGPVNVTKSLILKGNGKAVIDGGTEGFNVVGVSHVTIDRFTVKNTVGPGFNLGDHNGHPDAHQTTAYLTLSNNTVKYSGGGVPGTEGVEASDGFDMDYVTDSKFIGNHADQNGDSGFYFANASDRNTVVGNEASGNSSNESRHGNGIDILTGDNVVSGNILHDNQDSGIQLYPGASDNLVVNNVSFHNGDHGIDNLNAIGGRILNNTAFDNCTAGINVEGTSSGYTVENNVAVNNGTDATCAHGPAAGTGGQPGQVRIADGALTDPTTVADYNVVYNGVNGVLTPVSNSRPVAAHDLVADPQFANAAAADFHIPAASPAVGAADPVAPSGTPAKDFDGRARPAPASAGAFEGGSGGTTPPPTTPPTTPPITTPPATAAKLFQIGGTDRYATGLLVSQHRWQAGQADAVVLATGRNFADALAGVPLAAKAKGPLLLVDGSAPTVSPAVLAEIDRVLKPGGKVYLLGGTAAVSQGVQTQLAAAHTVQRFAGDNRYQTSVVIARDGLGSPKHAVVATGNGFADALASGPYATGPFADAAGAPAAILLSDDKQLDPAVAGYLAGKDGANIAAIGHQAAAAVPAAKTQLAGDDRFATDALVVAAFTGASAGKQVGVADGMNFPDALTGGAYMASLAAPGPIVLVDGASKKVPASAAAQLAARTGVVEGDIFGGPAVITPAMAVQIQAALKASTVVHVGF
jgi:parallel beta-helix repeat protein